MHALGAGPAAYLGALSTAMAAPSPKQRLEPDGRDAAQRRCAPLACAWEHCVQRHHYRNDTPACAARLREWEACVQRERNALALAAGEAEARPQGGSSSAIAASDDATAGNALTR